jgi:hypothetical protein
MTPGQVRLIPPYSLSVNFLNALFFSKIHSLFSCVFHVSVHAIPICLHHTTESKAWQFVFERALPRPWDHEKPSKAKAFEGTIDEDESQQAGIYRFRRLNAAPRHFFS